MNTLALFFLFFAPILLQHGAHDSASPASISHPSPYQLSWRSDVPLVIATWAGSRYGAHLTDGRTALSESDALHMRRGDVNRFDRGATYRYSPDLKNLSDRLGALTFAAPLALMASSRMRGDVATVGIMYLETFFAASAVSSVSKHLMPRYRPFAYNEDLDYETKTSSDPGKSFLSTQAVDIWSSLIFSARVFGDYHPDSGLKPYVWASAIVAGSAMGYLRYATGTHYPSDIIVGALVGSAIGYLIPELHRRTQENLVLAPSISSSEIALRISYVF